MLLKIPKYFFSKLKIHSFPYNFNGVIPNIQSEDSFKIDHFLQMAFQSNIKTGLSLAIESTLSAFCHLDKAFIKENFEPLFADETIESFYNAENSIKIKQYNQDHKINFFFTKFSMYLGANFNRKLGKIKTNKMKADFWNFFIPVNITDIAKNPRPIIRLEAYFKTKNRLTFSFSETIDFHDREDNLWHSVVFEIEGKELTSSFSTIMTLANSFNKEELFTKNFFRNVLLGDNYEWKISDFDDFMKGNELSV